MHLERDEEGYLYEYDLNQSYFLETSEQLEDYLTADLIVNTMYMRSKDRNLVESVLNVLDNSKFRLNVFPGKIYRGRGKKITFEKSSELTNVK